MTRIPLTISPNYLPTWGIAEAIRELVSNWLDASEATGTPGEISVTPNETDDTVGLTLHNPGATLGREALLLGHTTKPGTTQRGQFGEGIKGAAIVAARAKVPFSIFTDTEVWTASLGDSDAFPGQEVVVIDITPPEVDTGLAGVTASLGSIPTGTWATARAAFRHFREQDGDLGHLFEAEQGTAFFDEKLKGHVFVKGVLVNVKPDLDYGYDLKNANVDRDRKLVRDWDLEAATAQILSDASEAGHVSAEELLRKATAGSPDTRSFHYYGSGAVKANVIEAFKLAHGDDAVPCEDETQRKALGDAGRIGVVVPSALYSLLTAVLPTPEKALAEARHAVRSYVQDADLSARAQANLAWAVSEIREAIKSVHAPRDVAFPDIRVVDFVHPKTRIHRDGYNVRLSRGLLKERHALVAALVRQVARIATGGYNAEQVDDEVDAIWAALVKRWSPRRKGTAENTEDAATG